MRKHFIILAIFLLFLAVVTSPACKTAEETEEPFDIRGTWMITKTIASTINFQVTFSGGLTSGTAESTEYYRGEYTVSNNQVTLVFHHFSGWIYTHTGTITSESFMSGTVITNWGTDTGTWYAVK
jgi:hypothetical protein